MADLNKIKSDATARMQKCVEALKAQLMKLPTGRANAALLDHVPVDYYRSEVPVLQAGSGVVEALRNTSHTTGAACEIGTSEP